MRSPERNLALAKTYLSAHDPKMVTRTWSAVMEELATHGRESSQARCRCEMASKPYTLIRHKPVIQTTSEDSLAVLRAGGAATANYLRRLHNLALGLGWLAWPILAPKAWPKVRPKLKRAITDPEHKRSVAAEQNSERRHYYKILWHTGCAQTDGSNCAPTRWTGPPKP
ncbi:MAG: hypothetical protein JWM16_254 [Verrucomicrobiales bacterium]|nr:hypothetical protein [Verrucomicrobiales bacterium]